MVLKVKPTIINCTCRFRHPLLSSSACHPVSFTMEHSKHRRVRCRSTVFQSQNNFAEMPGGSHPTEAFGSCNSACVCLVGCVRVYECICMIYVLDTCARACVNKHTYVLCAGESVCIQSPFIQQSGACRTTIRSLLHALYTFCIFTDAVKLLFKLLFGMFKPVFE